MAKKTSRWGRQCEDRFNAPAARIIHEGRGDDCQDPGLEKSFPEAGMRMLTYFLNRGGKGLDDKRREELEKAKRLLSRRIHPVGKSVHSA